MTGALDKDGRRGITILGSTGSIGCNTVELVEARPDLYRVEALTANCRVEILADQARRLKPRLAVVADESAYGALKDALDGTGIAVAAGPAAVVEAAQMPAAWVMASIVGAAGLAPTLAAVRRGAVIGLANKECLVCAGALMTAEVAACRATLLPVDSEHSAIFQVLDAGQPEAVEKIVLTASGGPFRCRSLAEMEAMTPEQAVAHPNWSMGAKISVDSATMMNKGLELIEAHHLFAMPEERIDIVVHPQSVIHSMVSYVDGSVLAQLGSPDMRTPIASGLGFPDRLASGVGPLDLARCGRLEFETPDLQRFPCLGLAFDALRAGQAACVALNAANEVAVEAFLSGRLRYTWIPRVIMAALEWQQRQSSVTLDSLADVLAFDAEARAYAGNLGLA